jgi:hypothetical protein
MILFLIVLKDLRAGYFDLREIRKQDKGLIVQETTGGSIERRIKKCVGHCRGKY